MENTFDFSRALTLVKEGKAVARTGWRDKGIGVMMQKPDEHSKMTQPYLFMIKGDVRFPLDLSCESIFAEDWIEVEVTYDEKNMPKVVTNEPAPME